MRRKQLRDVDDAFERERDAARIEEDQRKVLLSTQQTERQHFQEVNVSDKKKYHSRKQLQHTAQMQKVEKFLQTTTEVALSKEKSESYRHKRYLSDFAGSRERCQINFLRLQTGLENAKRNHLVTLANSALLREKSLELSEIVSGFDKLLSSCLQHKQRVLNASTRLLKSRFILPDINQLSDNHTREVIHDKKQRVRLLRKSQNEIKCINSRIRKEELNAIQREYKIISTENEDHKRKVRTELHELVAVRRAEAKCRSRNETTAVAEPDDEKIAFRKHINDTNREYVQKQQAQVQKIRSEAITGKNRSIKLKKEMVTKQLAEDPFIEKHKILMTEERIDFQCEKVRQTQMNDLLRKATVQNILSYHRSKQPIHERDSLPRIPPASPWWDVSTVKVTSPFLLAASSPPLTPINDRATPPSPSSVFAAQSQGFLSEIDRQIALTDKKSRGLTRALILL